jgi:hypothetical protein
MGIHFVREKVACGQARIIYVHSRHQIADIFTKGEGVEKHKKGGLNCVFRN